MCLLFLCLFICLFRYLPVKGTQQTPTRGYKHQAGNGQSLLYKHWSNVYKHELDTSRNRDSVTTRRRILILVIVKSWLALGLEPTTL